MYIYHATNSPSSQVQRRCTLQKHVAQNMPGKNKEELEDLLVEQALPHRTALALGVVGSAARRCRKAATSYNSKAN